MKVAEEFVIAQPPQTLWEFFEQFDQVAQCVPGVEDVTVIDEDNSRVRLTQSLGPMTATFDVKMRVTERDPGRSMAFTAVGRSVRGAAGNVRANHVVRLADEGSGSTRVLLEGDVALGGMLGSVGQKVVAKQAAVVTQSFAQALQQRLGGGTMAAVENGDENPSASAGDPAEQASAGAGGSPAQASAGAGGPAAQASPASGAGAPAAGTPPPPPLPGGSGARNKIVRVVMAGAIVLALLEALRRLRSR
jgi:carbon monoxide dehydrogenase subunit G